MHGHGWMVALVLPAVVALLAPAAQAPRKPVNPTKEWSGSVDNEALAKDAPAVITSAKGLDKLWTAWQLADKRPEVDFAKEIVVVTTTRGSRLRLALSLDDKGNLLVGGVATRDLRPGFRYVIASVSREGIKTVNGKELPKE